MRKKRVIALRPLKAMLSGSSYSWNEVRREVKAMLSGSSYSWNEVRQEERSDEGNVKSDLTRVNV